MQHEQANQETHHTTNGPGPARRLRSRGLLAWLGVTFLASSLGSPLPAAAQTLEKFRASVDPSSGSVYTCRSNPDPLCAYKQCVQKHPGAEGKGWPCQKLNVADVGDGSYPYCAVGLYRLDPDSAEVFGMLSCAKSAASAEAAARMWGGENEKSLKAVRAFGAPATGATAAAAKAPAVKAEAEPVATEAAKAPDSKVKAAPAAAAAAKAPAPAVEAAPAAKAEAVAKPAPKSEAAATAKAEAVAKPAPEAAPASEPEPSVQSSSAKLPPTGSNVDASNLETYKHLLSPGMQWAVDRGAVLRVGPYRKIVDPPPYREATEKFSGQVKLSPDGTGLLNHVAGKPFPTVDKSDPWIATKLMFNFGAAIAIDDSDVRNFDCDTGQLGSKGNPTRVERHFLIDHIRRLFFRERLVVDPKPTAPNRDAARFKEALYPLIEPFDLKGTGFTFTRFEDQTRQDDTWLYLPQLRRVRRLSSAQRSDALFGQDTDADSYEGYQGNIAWMDWKLLGEQKILATMHAEHLPVKWGKPSGEFLHDDLWEPRDAWVVQGVSKLPQYAYSKRVIYLDKEIYRIPFSDMYDAANELWKLWVNNYKFATKPYPDAKYGQPWEYGYRPSIAMIDLQLEHGTSCALPSHRFPGEQGWYVNLGDEEGTTESFFELSAIIAAGR